MFKYSKHLLMFIPCSVVLYLYLYFTKAKILLFKDESGMFLSFAFKDRSFQEFAYNFLQHSYNGHYTPVAFLLELGQSRIFNVNENWWLVRQTLATTLFWICMSLLIKEILIGKSENDIFNNLVSIFLPGIFIFRPLGIEFLVFPFLSLQILCLSLALIGMRSLVRFARLGDAKDFKICLVFGYLTMHYFGMGLAFSVATLSTLTILMSAQKQLLKLNQKSFYIILGATLIHAILMLRTNHEEAPRVIGTIGFLARTGYLFLMSIFFSFRSFWGYDTAWPSDQDIYAISILGWATLITIFYIFLRFFRELKSTKIKINSFALTLHLFTLYLIYVLLVSYRTLNIQEISGIQVYLIGSRYILFPSVFIFIFTIFAILRLRIGRKELALFSSFFLVASILSNILFVRNVSPKVWPWMDINHSEIWNSYVQQSKQLLESNENLVDYKSTGIDSSLNLTIASHKNLLKYSLKNLN